jgi:hypothetical protein
MPAVPVARDAGILKYIRAIRNLSTSVQYEMKYIRAIGNEVHPCNGKSSTSVQWEIEKKINF